MSICTLRATGVVALAATLDPKRAFQLESIALHLSAAGGAGNFTATLDAQAGTEYDVNIITNDMTADIDVLFVPDRPLYFDSGDKIVFAWANAGGKTYGLEVKYSPQ